MPIESIHCYGVMPYLRISFDSTILRELKKTENLL